MKFYNKNLMKKNVLTLLFASLLTVAPSAASLDEEPTSIKAALENSVRMGKDVARDVNRKPAMIMGFSGVKSGQVIVDMIAGGGYYSELFSLVAGPSGKVYTHMSRASDERIAQFSNMEKLTDRNLADMDGKADVIFTALNYHDVVNSDKFDREAMLAGVKAHLNADGVFVVIDHAAMDGSGKTSTNTLHRIDKGFVIEEVLRAGFVLDGESDALHNAEDDRSVRVFDPSVRGVTDRFVVRFRVAK